MSLPVVFCENRAPKLAIRLLVSVEQGTNGFIYASETKALRLYDQFGAAGADVAIGRRHESPTWRSQNRTIFTVMGVKEGLRQLESTNIATTQVVYAQDDR